MAKIIGIAGLAGAGKDSFSIALERALVAAGYPARIERFAEPIRKMSAHMGLNPYDRETKERKHTFYHGRFWGLLCEAVEAVLAERVAAQDRARLCGFVIDAVTKRFSRVGCQVSISPRELMQIIGTEGGQRVHKGLWADAALMQWRALPGYVLVPDCRFEHEAKQMNYLFVVCRPGIVRNSAHVSEALAERLTNGIRPNVIPLHALRRVDNHGTLDDLNTLAERFVPFVTSVQ